MPHREFRTRRELMNLIPSWELPRYCWRCQGETNHVELGFDEAEHFPLLAFCERCEKVIIDTSISIQDKVRQLRTWQRWAQETGGPGPAEVWLFLLPGVPSEKTETSDAG